MGTGAVLRSVKPMPTFYIFDFFIPLIKPNDIKCLADSSVSDPDPHKEMPPGADPH